MQIQRSPTPKGRIRHLQFSDGPERLIALHGFGARAHIFADWNQQDHKF